MIVSGLNDHATPRIIPHTARSLVNGDVHDAIPAAPALAYCTTTLPLIPGWMWQS